MLSKYQCGFKGHHVMLFAHYELTYQMPLTAFSMRF